jgi:hypothetical protein
MLRQPARRGVEAVEAARARGSIVKNGCPAMTSPCIGLETEAERRSGRSNGFAKLACVVTKVQARNADLVMVRKRRYGRVKGRAEIPAPVGCESGSAVCGIDPRQAEMRPR